MKARKGGARADDSNRQKQAIAKKSTEEQNQIDEILDKISIFVSFSSAFAIFEQMYSLLYFSISKFAGLIETMIIRARQMACLLT